MNEIILRIVEIIAYIAVAVVCRYIIPFIKTKIDQSKYAFLSELIMDAVQATEQTIQGDKKGGYRKDEVTKYAIEICRKKGWNIDADEIETVIEACVKAMNEAV